MNTYNVRVERTTEFQMLIDSDSVQEAIETAKVEATEAGGVIINEVVTVTDAADDQSEYYYHGDGCDEEFQVDRA